tara:strand:- start:431 stop:631 length:201 start_codon:yes stop_codon:yes gene_type:complete
MYCICVHNNLLNKVKELNYIPVGLGDDNFNEEWMRDNTKKKIYRIKINIMVNIHFIIGFGKMKYTK